MSGDAPLPWPSSLPGAPAALERSNARLSVLAEVSHAFATVATDCHSLLGATFLFTLGEDR